jgi:hypothetical protein
VFDSTGASSKFHAWDLLPSSALAATVDLKFEIDTADRNNSFH